MSARSLKRTSLTSVLGRLIAFDFGYKTDRKSDHVPRGARVRIAFIPQPVFQRAAVTNDRRHQTSAHADPLPA